MMPRLLLIAYHYPPENTSGAARPARLARYLPEAGVECRVIARGSAEPVTEADAPAYQRWLCEKMQRFLLPYNERLPWLPAAVRAGSDLIRRERIDALYSTSPPLVTHLVAMELSRRFGLPWVADFRDPLVGNPWRRRRFRQYDPWLERRIFDRAALCLANTDSLADEWRKAHPAKAHKIRVLWNGYDPEAPVAEPVPQAGGPRTLLHAGSLYGFRRPGPLVRALARLAGEGWSCWQFSWSGACSTCSRQKAGGCRNTNRGSNATRKPKSRSRNANSKNSKRLSRRWRNETEILHPDPARVDPRLLCARAERRRHHASLH